MPLPTQPPAATPWAPAISAAGCVGGVLKNRRSTGFPISRFRVNAERPQLCAKTINMLLLLLGALNRFFGAISFVFAFFPARRNQLASLVAPAQPCFRTVLVRAYRPP